MTKKDFDYKKSRAELDELLVWFETSDVSVDQAITKYQRAEELLKELELYLADTQAKIELLTKNASKGE